MQTFVVEREKMKQDINKKNEYSLAATMNTKTGKYPFGVCCDKTVVGVSSLHSTGQTWSKTSNHYVTDDLI